MTGQYWLGSLWFNVCVCLQKVELLGASSLTGQYWLGSLLFNVCVCLQKVECYWVHLT